MVTTTLGDEATLRLAAGRAKAVQMMPYLATALFAMKPVRTEGLGTVGVDKRWRLYWDPAFMLTLDVDESAAAWLHEVGHLLREHSARFEATLEAHKRHPLWNAAGDATINADLRDAGVLMPIKPWYHENIPGADRSMVTEQLYRLLVDGPLINKVDTPKPPTLLLLPSVLRYDYPTPLTFRVLARNATFDATTAVTLIGPDADASGALGPLGVVNATELACTLTASVPPGSYALTATTSGVSISGTLHIVEPSIDLRPDHLRKNYPAPAKVVIQGSGTRFTAQTLVQVFDAAGLALPAVSKVTNPSSTYLTFEVPSLPDGVYTIQTTDGHETCQAALPIGLPYLTVAPHALPSGVLPPLKMTCTVEDLDFEPNSQIRIHNPALMGAEVPGAVSNVKISSTTVATFDLSAALDDGTYVVIVENPDGSQAAGQFTVGGDGGDGEGSSDGSGDDEGDGEAGSEGGSDGGTGDTGPGQGKGDGKGEGKGTGSPDLPDCGSGSGGTRRDHELPDSQNDDGSIDAGRGTLIRKNVAVAIAEHSRTRGSVPGGWQRWADRTLNPKVDWRKELNAVVRKTAANVAGMKDYSYSRPARRSAALPNIVLPSMRAPRPPSVFVVVDTSGSMSDDMLAQCLAEIQGILNRVANHGDPVRVIACDASATEVQSVRTVKKIDLVGGGGTDMRVGIRQAAQAKPRADLVIVLTDGETPWPDAPPPENPNARYVAVLVDGEASYSQVPAFMHKIVIEPEYMTSKP